LARRAARHTDADVINIPREAPRRSISRAAGWVSESHQAHLRDLEHECLDAARWLAVRDQTANTQ
jgi:hypothetical protein